jgi:Domain of unknown function (DUF4136)
MTAKTASFQSRARMVAVTLALAGLAACAQPFNAKVSRFQSQLPAPQNQTSAVVADDPALAGGLEFSQYSQHVSAQMAKLGYAPAASPESASLLVRFDYGVDKGRERVRSTGYRYDPFYSPWFGYARYPHWGGYYRPRGLWGYGFHDPFFDNGYESYTVYTSGIEMKIDSKADGRRLFEGKAEALSTSNRLQYLVPNLVEAMFTNFPGNSGETVRISIAPEKKKKTY